MDTELRHMGGFKLHGADIAQGLMKPLPIVEHFDEFKHRRLRRHDDAAFAARCDDERTRLGVVIPLCVIVSVAIVCIIALAAFGLAVGFAVQMLHEQRTLRLTVVIVGAGFAGSVLADESRAAHVPHSSGLAPLVFMTERLQAVAAPTGIFQRGGR